MPKLTLNGKTYLEVVEKFKLLGIHIRSDMKWYDNTDNICKKGYQRLWMLRRLKGLGANQSELLDVFNKQVRSVLELAVPAWNPGLTIEEEKQIERVQKTAFRIILGVDYITYEEALETLECETLKERRQKISLKFAKRALKHERYSTWFQPQQSQQNSAKPNTRAPKAKQNRFVPVPFRTTRYRDSPIPYLTELLNAMK